MSFDVDVVLRRGERTIQAAFTGGSGVTVLFGPSGAGKTTVLDMIAGLLRPATGHVRVGGRTLFDAAAGVNLPPEHRRVGYVFQDVRLFPHRRVRANLRYGARHRDRVEEVARQFDIAHLLDRWPRTLSGGEARRVAIARALLSEPDFLLLDEPLSSLDARRREEAIAAIEQVRADAGLPMILVTHDPSEAERLGDRVVPIG